MPSPSKQKGNRFEREVVKEAIERGLTAERAYGSNGKSLGLEEDVDVLIGKFKGQCKIRKRIAAWVKTPESCDITLVRENRGETFIVMPYDKFLNLITEENNGKNDE